MKHTALRRGIWIFLMTPYLKPAILGVLDGTAWLETIFDLWRLLAAAAVCAMYGWGLLRHKKRPSAVLIFLGIYLGFIAVSTVMRANNYWSLANYVLTILTFCMLLELCLRDSPRMALDMLVYPMTVLVWINFILLCIFPKGLCVGGSYFYVYHFLGIDNFQAPILIPYMFLVALRSTMKTGDLDWFAYCMIGVCALSLLLVWSATGLMGLAVALMFLLFFYQRRGQTLFNFVTAECVGFGLFFSVVLFRLQNLFAFFIEGVLHKGLSFTGRTDIWDKAIAMFLKSPFLGYGLGQKGKVYRLSKGKYYHAHNVFLEILMEGGIFSLIAYLLMLLCAGQQLMCYRKHPYACLISGGLMACALMTVMEPYLDSNGLLIYALIFLGYHVGSLIHGRETAPIGAK